LATGVRAPNSSRRATSACLTASLLVNVPHSNLVPSASDSRSGAQKALQTVAAGQHIENLLDFDDEPAADNVPTGLAATQILAAPAATSLLAGTSANPLDDLVSIFGNTSMAPTPPGAGFGASPPMVASPMAPTQANGVSSLQNPQEDLLGLF
jgi:AP-1 complex subunit beta-1